MLSWLSNFIKPNNCMCSKIIIPTFTNEQHHKVAILYQILTFSKHSFKKKWNIHQPEWKCISPGKAATSTRHSIVNGKDINGITYQTLWVLFVLLYTHVLISLKVVHCMDHCSPHTIIVLAWKMAVICNGVDIKRMHSKQKHCNARYQIARAFPKGCNFLY